MEDAIITLETNRNAQSSSIEIEVNGLEEENLSSSGKRKRSLTSESWTYFDLITRKDNKRISKCKKCGQKYPYTNSSSDVFGFGTFMLEMACGRKPVDPDKSPEEMVLVDLVLDWWKRGKILRTSDPRLEGNYVVQEMELVLKLGLLCSLYTPAARPSMRQVVQYLDGDAPLPDVNLDGASSGLTQRNLFELSGEIFLSFLATNEYDNYSADSLSSSDSNSILSSGP